MSDFWPGVSVIMPVLNEEKHLAAAVAGIVAQHYPGPLEIVIAVGPSRDRTQEIADGLAATYDFVTVVDSPTGRTPASLNRAIAASKYDILVRVDGHGELGPEYLTTAVRTLEETGAVNVGGIMDAQGETPFEKAVAAAYNSPFGLGNSTFHLAHSPAGPADSVFLGVFRKDALLAVGGFDETMYRAQDWELNHRFRQHGDVVWFNPALRVVYRPRSTARALARQFFKTGQWRREVVSRYPETASLRYLAPGATVVGTAIGGAAGVTGALTGRNWLKLGWLAPLVYLGFILWGTVRMGSLEPEVRVRMPLVLAIMHFAWGTGYLVGLRPGENPRIRSAN